MLNSDTLIDLLPITGQVHIMNTTSKEPEKRWRAAWEEVVGPKKTSVVEYGMTPRLAIEALVVSIRGPSVLGDGEVRD